MENNNSEHHLQRKINALYERIEELILEKHDINLETIELEKKNKSLDELNIATREQIFNLSTEKNSMYQQLHKIRIQNMEKDKLIKKLNLEIEKLKKLIDSKNGSFQMIEEILKGGTMVIHPEIQEIENQNNLKNRQQSLFIDTDVKLVPLVDDCGGFGMFEESPQQSDNEDIFNDINNIIDKVNDETFNDLDNIIELPKL